LDYSAFHFGNKYEEWARLLNYMVIHNPALERRLKKHIVNMRGETDYLDLRLMRIYKIGFLLAFYAQSLDKTSSDLHALTKRRIKFWHEVLQSVIDDKNLDEGILEDYLKNRDHLRSPEEKRRQKEFTLV
jgi:predicted solute-binding protein